jgi:hypothetical protein
MVRYAVLTAARVAAAKHQERALNNLKAERDRRKAG